MFTSEIDIAKTEIDEELTSIEKWSTYETYSLLSSYRQHQEAFGVTKLKQEVWELIQHDLAQQGINKSCFHIANKWKNLLRTYKNIKQSNRPAEKIRFQYMNAMANLLQNHDSNDTKTHLKSNNHVVELNDKSFIETASTTGNQTIALEFSEDNLDEITNYIDYTTEDECLTSTSKKFSKNYDNADISKNSVVDLKIMYLKSKIADVAKKSKEREKYLSFIRETKELKRKREECKLKLKEKELEIEERKVCALEQYLALKQSNTV